MVKGHVAVQLFLQRWVSEQRAAFETRAQLIHQLVAMLFCKRMSLAKAKPKIACMHTVFADAYANNESSDQCITLTVPTLWRATAVEKWHWKGHSPVYLLTGVCVCPSGRNVTTTVPVKKMEHV